MIYASIVSGSVNRFDSRWISFNLFRAEGALYYMTPLHDYPLFTMVSYIMITSSGQSSAVRAHLVAMQPCTGSTSMYITPLIDCGDETVGFESTQHMALKTTSKQATRQLSLCYHRKPNQSAECCSLKLNCTHHNVPNTCEERCLHSDHRKQKGKWENTC